jgi:hypothetical protein
MNTIRMFAFVVAVLITAYFLRAIADGFAVEEPIPATIAAHGAASDGPKSSADRSSP